MTTLCTKLKSTSGSVILFTMPLGLEKSTFEELIKSEGIDAQIDCIPDIEALAIAAIELQGRRLNEERRLLIDVDRKRLCVNVIAKVGCGANAMYQTISTLEPDGDGIKETSVRGGTAIGSRLLRRRYRELRGSVNSLHARKALSLMFHELRIRVLFVLQSTFLLHAESEQSAERISYILTRVNRLTHRVSAGRLVRVDTADISDCFCEAVDSLVERSKRYADYSRANANIDLKEHDLISRSVRSLESALPTLQNSVETASSIAATRLSASHAMVHGKSAVDIL